ncbi:MULTISPECIES: ImmA/IrrE family metallo-endopeptidase [Cytobacillus]|uniref:ImmA/IrrE family metallo-endopeptidase n=1 Tax=Cytobacillus TaxID=2675230 RepID=UPI001F50A7C1|nr:MULTISPECIES: ImmA/IrrE family metallo-endopeptidase [Cytobacillus]MED1939680.1 ImmA/IrrE family metallo-endopeptidase [Cytobacillus firmus]
MTWIKTAVSNITKKYKTNNPFELAAFKNVHVIEWDLHHEIKGFYKYDKKNKYIVINSNLLSYEKYFTCAHELGHSQLHPRVNTPFLRENTLFSTSRIEVEANTYAVELLIPDSAIHKNYHSSIYDVAAMHGVPKELVHLKKF